MERKSFISPCLVFLGVLTGILNWYQVICLLRPSLVETVVSRTSEMKFEPTFSGLNADSDIFTAY